MHCNDLLERVTGVLSPVLPAGGSILLGLSGGVDSVVLLHLLQQLSSRYSWRLSALHVHHGISPQADAWAALCADLCLQHGIPLQIEHVDIAPLRELGIEAAARKLRHAALARQRADVVALAHHLDDQAETMLLQLLRGAGVRGASAMPAVRHRANAPLLVRPLLDVPRSVLIDYAQQHALQWVEDESNADDAYPRNFLRHRILPVLEQRFPAYRETLARSARHFAEASGMLDELARLDASDLFPSDKTTSHSTRLPKYGSQAAGYPASGRGARGEGDEFRLEVSRLQSLSQPRAKNLLRYFLAEQGAPVPDSTQLEEMMRQLYQARSDAALCIAFGGWQLRRYHGQVYALPELSEGAAELNAQWRGEAMLDFPELNGSLSFQPCIGQGLNLEKLRQGTVTVHARRGGESIQPDAARPRRTLKNLLQEHGVPPWQRNRLPLLFCGDELICVPGIVTANAYQAKSGEQGVQVCWRTQS